VPLLPSDEIAVVTFNPKRVSEADVRRWMLLADHARYSSPDTHTFYSCDTSDIATYEPRLQSELSKSRQVVTDLNPNSYPPELSHVVMYLKRLQSFWVWQVEQELGYVASNEAPALEWQDVDCREKCDGMSERLRNSRSKNDECRIVFLEWHNCMNKCSLDQLGPYPKADWENFLRVHDLQVKIISTAND
jgi:hypothetical protein